MSDKAVEVVKEVTTIEGLVVKIAGQLATAIEKGVEKLPAVTELLIGELSNYYMASVISMFILAFVCLAIALGCIKWISWTFKNIERCNKDKDLSCSSDEKYAVQAVASCFIFIVVAVIFICSLISGVNDIPKAVSPVGHIIHSQIIK